MEKSIEQIWTQGFLNEKNIQRPTIENLFNRKSILLVEKIKQTYKRDNIALLPMAFISLAACLYFDRISLGIYLLVILSGLFFLNKRSLIPLESLDLNKNSFEYLTSYRKCIQNIIKSYTRVFAVAAPIAIIGGYLIYMKDMEIFQSFVSNNSYIKLALLLAATGIILSGVCVFIYKLSTHLVYGNHLNSLDEMISDLTELKK